MLSYYKLAEDEGAKVLTGAARPRSATSATAGRGSQPTIWTGPGAQTPRVNREEIFGPAVHSRRSTPRTRPSALANDTEYGLAATVLDPVPRARTGSRRSSTPASSGSTAGSCAICALPFGGVKASGIGREGGVHSLEFYTELTNVCIKI